MKVIKILLVVLISFMSISAMAGNNQIVWSAYSKDIFKKSKQERRPVLLFFKADWCPHCAKVKSTTLTSPNVVKMVNENYIPVMIDIDSNRELAQEYYVMKLPTFLILDSNQKAIDSFTGEVSVIDLMGKLSEDYKTYEARITSSN